LTTPPEQESRIHSKILEILQVNVSKADNFNPAISFSAYSTSLTADQILALPVMIEAKGVCYSDRLEFWHRSAFISFVGLVVGLVCSVLYSFAMKLMRSWGYDGEYARKRLEYRRRVINSFQHSVNKLIHMVRSEIAEVGVLVAKGKELEIIDINNTMRGTLHWPDEFTAGKVCPECNLIEIQMLTVSVTGGEVCR
jgi:hypothetical protein